MEQLINGVHSGEGHVCERRDGNEEGSLIAAVEQVSITLDDYSSEQTFSPAGRIVPTPLLENSNSSISTRCVLEEFTQCSKSHLWKLMMSFYDRKGPESWSHGIVPHFITCNAFIGRTYAKVLHGFLHDCAHNGRLDVKEPLYIIELGAGSGKFSFYMLRALEELQEMCVFPFSKIVYVMTDFTEANFSFWRSHPSLKPYFERGLLDAGIFDAVNDTTIKLWRSGITLQKDSCVNPICIVANYLFDTLCHDIFQVDGGELKEGLISVGSRHASEPDPLDPEIIQRLENLYCYRDISPDYYTNEEGDEASLSLLLNWYRENFKKTVSGASFLVPIGALRALRRLSSFSSGGTVVISGDKGNNSPEQFIGIADPYIAVHGSFSLMVNYHAIGLWFTSRGGFALHNPQEEASLKVSCFVLPSKSETTDVVIDGTKLGAVAFLGDEIELLDEKRAEFYKFLRLNFREAVQMFGPNDYFGIMLSYLSCCIFIVLAIVVVLQKSLKEDVATPSLRAVVSMLK